MALPNQEHPGPPLVPRSNQVLPGNISFNHESKTLTCKLCHKSKAYVPALYADFVEAHNYCIASVGLKKMHELTVREHLVIEFLKIQVAREGYVGQDTPKDIVRDVDRVLSKLSKLL